MLSALLFGILPALDAGRIHTFGARGSNGAHRSRVTREVFVALQMMLTIILLTASVSVGRAFVNLLHIDRGFEAKQLVTVSVSLDGTTHQLAKQQLPYFEEVLARIRNLPGVRSASLTDVLPLYTKDFTGGPLGLDGHSAKENSMVVSVLADYFETTGGHILYGREFTDAEIRSGAKVAVVNVRFADQFGSPAHALGRQVTIGSGPPWKIVGVVRGMDYMTPGVNASQVFRPAHSAGAFAWTFIARVTGNPSNYLAMIRDTIRSVDPQVPIVGAETMKQRLEDALSRPKCLPHCPLFLCRICPAAGRGWRLWCRLLCRYPKNS